MTQECNIDKINTTLSDLLDQLNRISQSKEDNDNKQPSEIQSDAVLPELRDQLKAVSPSKEDNVFDNKQPNEIQNVEKRPSFLWVWLRRKIFKRKTEAASDNGGSSKGGSSSSRRNKQNIGNDEEDADLEIQRLKSDILRMKTAFQNLTQFEKQMSKSLELTKLKPILENKNSIRSRSHDLKEIRRKIVNLKCQIPSLLLKQSTKGLSNADSQTADENGLIDETGSDIYLPGLYVSEDFKRSSAFEEVVEIFINLEFTQKLCLLSFAVFPENREVKRTMLMYWWIGEGYLISKDSESSVTKILDEFSTKGLLEEVDDERKMKPNSYKMEPHVHSAVVYLSEICSMFVLYSKGKPIMERSDKDKICLVRGSSLQPGKRQPNLETIFNSSERYPDFTFKWFPKMNSLRVLYLGRWERTATRHIEVESTESLKDIKDLTNLRLASFQGISRIEKLENPICALPELEILDLRACYNLEVLPDDIGSLKNLIYLDVSECYMLDRMPKTIAQLSKLKVLKGFVIGQSDDEKNCAVKDLVKLRKLTITVNKYLFKVENLMESLRGLDQLESLKIAWGARFSENEQRGKKSKGSNEAEEDIESTHEEMENQRDPETEKKQKHLKEQEDEQVQKSEEKKGNEGETGKGEVVTEDEVSSKKVENEKANLEEGKKHGEVKEESSKLNKVDKGEKKTSPSQEAIETIQNKPGDQEEEKNGEKGKDDLEEGKKLEEVKEESLKFEKEASPSQEATETIQNKPDDPEEMQKAVKVEKSKSDKAVEEERKGSSPDTIQKKPDDKSKGDGDKGKEANVEKGKEQDEVEADKSKLDNGVEGLKASRLRELADAIKKKPDDHQIGEKQEEKGDGGTEKVNLEEAKNKDEVKTESSKPDKIITGDEKTNLKQESEDAIQSKPGDHKENNKVEEKVDGEARKSSDKAKKLGKKVSFSENPLPPTQKKADDEMPSKPEKKAPKESGFRKAKHLWAMRRETKKWERRNQETTTVDKFPSSLKKLELECFPEKNPPSWLNPKTLDTLEKLYIKGGKLSRISEERPTAVNNCRVQILRLKYLNEFKAEWKELQALFPRMILLEKYQCPKVAFCPTDGNGIWRSQPQTSPNM